MPANQPSNELYAWIFDSINDSVFSTNDEGVILSWNKASEKLTGYSASEIISKPITSIFSAESLKAIKYFIQSVSNNQIIDELEVEILLKDGKKQKVSIHIQPLKKDDTKIVGTICKLKLNAAIVNPNDEFAISESKYKTLFELSPVPMWVIELPSLKFLAVNEKAIEYYGYTREEFLAMTAYDIRPDEEKLKLKNINRTVSNYVHKQEEWLHFKKDGTAIIVEINSHGITYDGKSARMISSMDITERKRSQKKNTGAK